MAVDAAEGRRRRRVLGEVFFLGVNPAPGYTAGMATFRTILGLLLLSILLGGGLSFLVMGCTTPVGLSRAHAELHRERTPETLAAWEWERTTGCYIFQAKLAAKYSVVFAVLVVAVHGFLEIRKRPG